MRLIKKLISVLAAAVLAFAVFAAAGACSRITWEDGKLKVAATTTMVADLAKNIGGDKVTVIGIMNTGIDPHSYNPTMGDNRILSEAQVIIYSGLHLEGKMVKVLEALADGKRHTLSIGDSILSDRPESLLENDPGIYDPHIWFDVSLWRQAAEYVSRVFCLADPGNAGAYQANLSGYTDALDGLEDYILEQVASIDQSGRVLVTAHDAFGYFAKAYGFEVRGIQGINTDSEASTKNISELADFIYTRGIKAVFTETSVNDGTVKALQAAVASRGGEVKVGGELYADSLGDARSGTAAYIDAFRHNIYTIVSALI